MTDDEEEMLMENPDLSEMEFASCIACTRKHEAAPTCDAFPDGIPEEILAGSVPHITPYPGDGGLTFSPVPDASAISFSWRTAKISMEPEIGFVRESIEAWNRSFTRRRWSEDEETLRTEYDRLVSWATVVLAHLDPETAMPHPKRLTRWGPPPSWSSSKKCRCKFQP